MKTVLVIRSSLFGGDAESNRLADRVVARLGQQHGGIQVVDRDLGTLPIPHLDAGTFAAFATSPLERDEDQAAAVALSDQLVGELREADFIVIAAPMYNFGVSSAFKAWFDQVTRAGMTFAYTPEGPRGLLADRPVFVVSTRGGRYAGTESDLQSPYLRQILEFVGLTDLRFIYAEGLANNQARVAALSEAGRAIDSMVA